MLYGLDDFHTRHIEIIRYFPGRPGIRVPGPRAAQKQ
jgi:hypothetical protein